MFHKTFPAINPLNLPTQFHDDPKKEIALFVSLSKSLKELKRNIDKKYSRLSKITQDYEQARGTYF